jgi:hypothetical protein
MEERPLDTDRLAYLLAIRTRIEWDWPDEPGRDLALRAADDALRHPAQEHAEKVASQAGGVKGRLERQARNEALLREVNERIESVGAGTPGVGEEGYLEFLCECGQGERCELSAVRLTVAEYEEVRTQDDRFAVYPGHENPALERVVKRTERYVLVDKVSDAEPFVADDPRGAPSS